MSGEQLRARVQELTEGTPYEVTATSRGFDVSLALADAQWYEIFSREGLRKTFVHHVACDDAAQTFTITDDEHEVVWRAGTDGLSVPRLGGSISRQTGTIKKIEFNKTYGFDDKGRYRQVVGYGFNSEEGRRLIRQAAEEAGWSQRMSTTSRIGLIAGLIGAAVALLTVIAVVVVLLVR